MNDRVEELEEALRRIMQWSEAYPVGVFPEPDVDYYKRAADALTAAGLSLDRLSAAAMRGIVVGVGRIAKEALG